MLPLVLVQVACDRVGSLPHVLRGITLCLLDVDAIELSDVVKENDLELLKYLVLDPNCPLGGGFSTNSVNEALEVAIAENRMEFFQFLVANGPVSLPMLSRVAHFAAELGNLEVLQWLVEHRYVASYSWVLEQAAWSGRVQVLRFLIEFALDDKESHAIDGVRLACMAAQHGHLAVVKYLLKESKLTINNIKPIRDWAADHAHLRLVGWLDSECSEAPRHPTGPFDSVCISLSNMLQIGHTVETLGKFRDVEELQWFVKQFPRTHLDPNLLVFACEVGDFKKAEWLVGNLMPRNRREAVLNRALNKAFAHGHVDCVKLLLQHGARQDSLVLDEAVVNGRMDMVQFLQQEYNITSFKDFEKSIAEAAQNMHLEMVLLFDPFFHKSYPSQAFWNAARTGHIPMLQFLLSKPHDQGIYYETMKHAFGGGQLEAARVLFEYVRSNGPDTVLRQEFVSLRRELQAVEVFYDNGPEKLAVFFFLLSQEPPSDLVGEDFTRVLNAVNRVYHYMPLVHLLHERKAPGLSGSNIIDAACRGFFRMVRFLLEDHSFNRVCNLYTRNAFYEAANNGHLDIVKYMFFNCERSFNISIKVVAGHGHWRVLKFLHEHKAIQCSSGGPRSVGSAFLDAARNGHLLVVKYLLANYEDRVELDIQQAFCCACCGGYVNVAKWLMEHEPMHVDVALALKAARNSMETAEYNGLDREQVLSLLEKHLNDSNHTGLDRQQVALLYKIV